MERRMIVVAAALCCLLAGCRSVRMVERPVVVERVRTDTVRLAREVAVRDTVVWRDSVVVRADGRDTWHVREVTRWRDRRDTVFVSRRDSVPVVTEVTRVVREPLSDRARLLCSFIGVLIGVSVLTAIRVFVR